MGPFSNNTPSPSSGPRGGSKLPVPDVEGAPQPVFVSTEPDNSLAAQKWFTVTMIIAAGAAGLALLAFLVYVFISNTPGSILGTATQKLITSGSEAGTVLYESGQGQNRTIVNGDFLAYTDPTNESNSSLTLSLGPTDGRVSSTLRLLPEGNYFQTAGLGNLGRFIQSFRGNSSLLTADELVKLGNLDGQWYTLTNDDIFDLQNTLPRQVQAGPTSGDIDTLKQLYLKHQFLSVGQQLPDERISDVNTMHLRLKIDSARLQQFLAAVKAANIKSLQLTDDDLQAITSGKAFGQPEVEVWINKADRSFQQIKLTRPQTDTLTITFRSELAAAQRQSVVRPQGTKSATALVRGLQDALTTRPAVPTQ